MEAYEIIELIRTSRKKTPVQVVLQEKEPCEFHDVQEFTGGNGLKLLFGDWKVLEPQLQENAGKISALRIDNSACNSAIPMLDLKPLHARVEPGAVIREGVEKISVSAGVAFSPEKEEIDFRRLYETADQGMYESKRTRAGKITFCELES